MAATGITFSSLVDSFGRAISSILVPLLFALALMFFLYGVFKFIKGAASEEERKEGKKIIFVGLIALAVMVSIWGLVRIVAGTIGERSITIPQVKVKDLKR